MKKSSETLLVAFKEICIEMKAGKSKYMVRAS